jgi:hypothetical protein
VEERADDVRALIGAIGREGFARFRVVAVGKMFQDRERLVVVHGYLPGEVE